MNRCVTIDGNKYAVSSGSYIRNWMRSFSSSLASSIIRLNYVDRGPGLRTYHMTLQLATWSTGSEVYQDGVTKSASQQMSDLEASYAKIATSIQFLDIFGNPPSASKGVYFTNLNQIIPNYSTVAKTYILAEVELTESTQVVA
jgi:hypothetical protein